jgi:hypothetical protein
MLHSGERAGWALRSARLPAPASAARRPHGIDRDMDDRGEIQNAVATYQATVVEVADRDNALRSGTTGYGAAVVR